jgi:hypothetical protein
MNDQVARSLGHRLSNSISHGGVGIRNPLPRAAARFKSGIARLTRSVRVLLSTRSPKSSIVSPPPVQSRHLQPVSISRQDRIKTWDALARIWGTFEKTGTFDTAAVAGLLESALERHGGREGSARREFAARLVSTIANLTNSHEQHELLLQLFRAMFDQFKRTPKTLLSDAMNSIMARAPKQNDRLETRPTQDCDSGVPEAPTQAPENEAPEAIAPIAEVALESQVSSVEAGQPTIREIGSMVSEIDSVVLNDHLLKLFAGAINVAKNGVITSDLIMQAVLLHLQQQPESQTLQIRDFFNRHAWIPSYFIKGDTQAEQMFGHVARAFLYHANILVLDGREFSPEYWVERQEARMARFEQKLMTTGYVTSDGEVDPARLVQEYVDGIAAGHTMSNPLSPFQMYFVGEERHFDEDLLRVRNKLDYIEVLADIADSVRFMADSHTDSFKSAVKLRVSDRVQDIARRYSAIADIHPVATSARADQFHRTGDVDVGQRRADEIAMVADAIRDANGRIAPSPTRPERQEFERLQKKIIEKKGDVHQALWELRREEKDRPTQSRPRRMARTAAPRNQKSVPT